MLVTEAIQKISNTFQVPVTKIETNTELQLAVGTVKGTEIYGLNNILNSINKYSKTKIAQNSLKNPEIEAQVNQWIEYALMYSGPGSKEKQFIQHLLRDFDAYLRNRSYLVDQFLTLADLINYYAIYDLIKSLNVIEKEKYLNLCRWFDHLQHHSDICHQEDLVNFAVVHLH